MRLTIYKVINSIYTLSRTVFQSPRNSGQIIAFNKGCLSLVHPFSVTSANIAINDISLKLDSLDYIIIADSLPVWVYLQLYINVYKMAP